MISNTITDVTLVLVSRESLPPYDLIVIDVWRNSEGEYSSTATINGTTIAPRQAEGHADADEARAELIEYIMSDEFRI